MTFNLYDNSQIINRLSYLTIIHWNYEHYCLNFWNKFLLLYIDLFGSVSLCWSFLFQCYGCHSLQVSLDAWCIWQHFSNYKQNPLFDPYWVCCSQCRFRTHNHQFSFMMSICLNNEPVYISALHDTGSELATSGEPEELYWLF